MALITAQVTKNKAYEAILLKAAHVKQLSQRLSAQSASTGLTADQIVGYASSLKQAQDLFAQMTATPGLAQYAKDLQEDQNYEIVTEYQTMNTQITATLVWISANLPSSTFGHDIIRIEADGSPTWRSFTPAQTAGFRTELDALAATID